MNYVAVSVFDCVLFVSLTFVTYCFNKVNSRVSLEQIYNKLNTKKTPGGKRSIINFTHTYLSEHTFEELILFNLKFSRNKYFPDRKYFFMPFVMTICTQLAVITYANSDNYFKLGLLLLVPTLITSSPIIILWVVNRVKGINKTPFIKLCFKVISYADEILTIMFLSLLVGLVIFSVSSILLGILPAWVNSLTNDDNILKLVYNKLLNFNIKDVEGYQFSLAGFYFTLAVSGTVVFSIIGHYIKVMQSLREQLSKQVEQFKKLYSEYCSYLSLGLLDLLSDYSSVENFETALSIIQTSLDNAEVGNKISNLVEYYLFILFVAIIYILSIGTIVLPKELANSFFLILLVTTIIFLGSLFKIYLDYSSEII